MFEAPAAGRAILRVTGHSVYRATLNGAFLGYGPARAAHGYYRVDEWDLTPRLRPGRNVIALEVARTSAMTTGQRAAAIALMVGGMLVYGALVVVGSGWSRAVFAADSKVSVWGWPFRRGP